ncbi:MAG: hypothetical protein IT349_21700 [Candidatus Eisenbacteria bacterium]|nr:hypothetical protein [Candidatus Eisenbacteria bacterium]
MRVRTDSAADAAEIVHPALLVRLTRLFREDMTDHELYEATRGVWRLSPRRAGVRYVLAVFRDVVREAYAVDSWHPAGSTPYETRPVRDVNLPDRWEFVGAPAPSRVRALYVGRSVREHFSKGSRNPVIYVGC